MNEHKDSWMVLWESQQELRHKPSSSKAPLRPDPLEGHRGHELYQTWALYRRGGDRTKSPVAKGGWSEPTDVAHDCEPAWVVQLDHLTAYLTRINEAYEQIIERRYLEDLALWEVAEKVKRTEGFVLLSLRAICDLAIERVKA
jgi:hypothetical protein